MEEFIMLDFLKSCYFCLLFSTFVIICIKTFSSILADFAANDIAGANNCEEKSEEMKYLKWSFKGKFNWNFSKAKRDALEFRREKNFGEIEFWRLCVLFVIHFLQALVGRFSVPVIVKSKEKKLTVEKQEKLFKKFCKNCERYMKMNKFLFLFGIFLSLPFIFHLVEFLVRGFCGVNIFGEISKQLPLIMPISGASLLFFVAGRFSFSRERFGVALIRRKDRNKKLYDSDRENLRGIIDRNKKKEEMEL